jgi:hypothetical protein
MPFKWLGISRRKMAARTNRGWAFTPIIDKTPFSSGGDVQDKHEIRMVRDKETLRIWYIFSGKQFKYREQVSRYIAHITKEDAMGEKFREILESQRSIAVGDKIWTSEQKKGGVVFWHPDKNIGLETTGDTILLTTWTGRKSRTKFSMSRRGLIEAKVHAQLSVAGDVGIF